jgi:hypothetical protein
MAKAQLKLLLFLIVLGVAAGCVAVAYWIFDRIFLRESRIAEDLKSKKGGVVAKHDPGARRFDAAIDLIRESRFEDGREALYKLLQQFPESPTTVEAKRIIGEINMDLLFSISNKAGKKDYIVQPGDSLNLIAARQNSTLDTIVRMNALSGTMLQPGDHLTLLTLEFDVVVDVSDKTVIVTRKDAFFKEFFAFDIKLPPGTRVPSELNIGVKQALLAGKPVPPTDARYVEAEKWVPANKAGVIFRTVPSAKPVTEAPKPETVTSKKKSKGKSADETAVDSEPVIETGIFLAKEDLEELFALVRNGSKLTLVR